MPNAARCIKCQWQSEPDGVPIHMDRFEISIAPAGAHAINPTNGNWLLLQLVAICDTYFAQHVCANAEGPSRSDAGASELVPHLPDLESHALIRSLEALAVQVLQGLRTEQ